MPGNNSFETPIEPYECPRNWIPINGVKLNKTHIKAPINEGNKSTGKTREQEENANKTKGNMLLFFYVAGQNGVLGNFLANSIWNECRKHSWEKLSSDLLLNAYINVSRPGKKPSKTKRTQSLLYHKMISERTWLWHFTLSYSKDTSGIKPGGNEKGLCSFVCLPSGHLSLPSTTELWNWNKLWTWFGILYEGFCVRFATVAD